MMKVICEYASDCNDESCPHRQSHEPSDGCDHTCQSVANARCVVDTAEWPEFRETEMTAIFIKEGGLTMDIEMFDKPGEHPFGMLEGYKHATEKESFLAWMLFQCIEKGAFVSIHTKHEHPVMVEFGLLERTGQRQYALTRKARGLLYAYYGKDSKAARA